MKNRIWELDAFRGLCILGMVIVHFVYDIAVMYRIVDWQLPDWFSFVQTWGNIFFILLSGICVTLGHHHVKRGLIVIGGGLLCTAASVLLYKLGFDKSILIYFGVLHCLGVCMLLWALFRRLPSWALSILGIAMVAVGMYLRDICIVDFPWLMPLGFTYPGFASSDYFPLFPNLGFFLLGAVLGRILYQEKRSLLPNVSPKNPIVATLLFFGKHSLIIYLLHQPILSGLCMLIGG